MLKPKALASLCNPTFSKKHACFAAQDRIADNCPFFKTNSRLHPNSIRSTRFCRKLNADMTDNADNASSANSADTAGS
jgi:hypothetical protein